MIQPSHDFQFLDPPEKQPQRNRRGSWWKRVAWLCSFLLLSLLSWQIYSAWVAQRSRRLLATDAIALPTPRAETFIAPAKLPSERSEQLESPSRPWEQAVVTIESPGLESRHVHGSGVIIEGENNSRFVATNLHVMRPCVEALVRLSDGTTYTVAGYAAVDAEHDLALLALRDAPASLPVLKLSAADPPPRQRVWAIGHPQGQEFSTTAGEVSRVVESSALPPDSQRFVRQFSEENVRWIQHTARVSEGNSGGPLLDEQGTLLGLNTWVEANSGFSYAIHARYFLSLLAQPSGELVALADVADPQARAKRALWDLSATRLRTLREAASSMQWRLTQHAEYRQLQELAYGLTVALLPDALEARGELADKLNALIQEADQVVAAIKKQPWDDPGLITLVNEFADAELARTGVGVFIFVSVERMVEGKSGERGLIANLAGFERPVFIALPHDQLSVPEAGAQCLVLGVNPRGEFVKYGDNPLKPIVAPVIVTKSIFDLEQ